MKMGLRDANQNFSKAIRMLKAGHKIVLTERGKPIATITPIVADATRQDELQPLRDEGFLTGRQQKGPLRASLPSLSVKGGRASKALQKERDED